MHSVAYKGMTEHQIAFSNMHSGIYAGLTNPVGMASRSICILPSQNICAAMFGLASVICSACGKLR